MERVLAAASCVRPFSEAEPLLVAETVDGLLTQLGLLLWHEQVGRWEKQNLAWTEPHQINEATTWYLLGQRAGDRPAGDARPAIMRRRAQTKQLTLN